MSFCENVNRSIRVRDRVIGNGHPIFLTAEIGCAHNGNFESVKKMIIEAAKAGCDGADVFIASPNGQGILVGPN